MNRSERDVDAFIASLPEPAKQDIAQLDGLIQAHMPNRQRVLWEGVFWGGTNQSIIGYGDFRYRRSDKQLVEWFMVGLALQKNHISLYISAVEDGQYVAKKYGDRLGKVKIGSSSIGFRKLTDVNVGELMKLVDIANAQIP